jgi:hypothetical protein
MFRVCRGCNQRHGETSRALGPWALLDAGVGSPTGVCFQCAGKLQWAWGLLAAVGTPRWPQAILEHNRLAREGSNVGSSS